MAELDLSIYYPIPLLTTEGYVSLTKTMLDVAPKDPPQVVEVAKKDLSQVRNEVEAGLVVRIDEDLSTRIERSFDSFVDRVWNELRDRLAFYTIYMHEGAAKFTDADRAQLDFDHRVEQARVAAKIIDRIFAQGADFLREKFPQQATHMAARLDWVESKELDKALAELVTPELLGLIKVCQVRYEAMVNERSSRDGKSLADLRALRNKLRCQLYVYCGAVGTIYDPDKPATAKIVQAALRPILIARAQARRKDGANTNGSDNELAALDSELAALDELGPNEAEGTIEDNPPPPVVEPFVEG